MYLSGCFPGLLARVVSRRAGQDDVAFAGLTRVCGLVGRQVVAGLCFDRALSRVLLQRCGREGRGDVWQCRPRTCALLEFMLGGGEGCQHMRVWGSTCAPAQIQATCWQAFGSGMSFTGTMVVVHARLRIPSHPVGAVHPVVGCGCITWRQVCRQCRIVALHAEGFTKSCVTWCTAVLQLAMNLCCGQTALLNGAHENSASTGVRLRVCSRVATAAHEAMLQVCNPIKEQRDRHMISNSMHPCCLNVHSKETAPKALELPAA